MSKVGHQLRNSRPLSGCAAWLDKCFEAFLPFATESAIQVNQLACDEKHD
jgi:hypothetical protein